MNLINQESNTDTVIILTLHYVILHWRISICWIL